MINAAKKIRTRTFSQFLPRDYIFFDGWLKISDELAVVSEDCRPR
jgi:hypothetical protein